MNRHLVNLTMFFVFTLMVALPFSLFKTEVKNNVLGEVYEKPYYKRVTNFYDTMLLRTISKTDSTERDFVTVMLEPDVRSIYYNLYEVVNLSEDTLSFTVAPVGDALGEFDGKRLILKYQEHEVVLYQDDRYLDANTEGISFELLPGEKGQVNLLVENTEPGVIVSPLSFDLVLEKH